MKYILITIFLNLAMLTFAQSSNKKSLDEEDTVYVITKGGYIYPQGESAFNQFLQNNVLLDSSQAGAAKNHSFSFYIDIDSTGATVNVKSFDESDVAANIINALNKIHYWNPTYVYLKNGRKFLYHENFIWIGIYFDDNCIPIPTVCYPKDESNELK